MYTIGNSNSADQFLFNQIIDQPGIDWASIPAPCTAEAAVTIVCVIRTSRTAVTATLDMRILPFYSIFLLQSLFI